MFYFYGCLLLSNNPVQGVSRIFHILYLMLFIMVCCPAGLDDLWVHDARSGDYGALDQYDCFLM